MTKKRILLIGIIGSLIFAVLLGGRLIYQKEYLNANISQQSQKIPGVVSAKIVNDNGQDEMIVTTNNLSNLRQASQTLEKLAGDIPIRYLDKENDTLNKLFEQMQFAIQEGIMRGDFTLMAQTLKTQAEKAGVQLELEMDNNAIYVILNQGNAQLIQVIERHGQGKFLATQKE